MTHIITYQNTLKDVYDKEIELNCFESLSFDKAYKMMEYLQIVLKKLKQKITSTGFKSTEEEITFFKKIKPKILGKLIFYNKVYQYESNCPNNNFASEKYYNKKLQELYLEYKKYLNNHDFYKYYKTSRTDKDSQYFTLGHIDTFSGINSFVFEIDLEFSTYYDYKIARIIAHDLLYIFLSTKVNLPQVDIGNANITSYQESITWSESQNALIELIYALHVAGSINHGKGEIRKIASLFQELFGINLLDIHHAFHRMKTRAKSRTSYLDKLKESLEDYMDRD